MNIADVIEAAEFDEYDVDMGTAGLCVTFALALKQVFPDVDLTLVVLVDQGGSVCVNKQDGIPLWKHVVGLHNGVLLDVDGAVKLEHVIENYCWDNRFGKGGKLFPISHEGLREIAMADNRSFDDRWFEKWATDLARARSKVLEREVSAPAI